MQKKQMYRFKADGQIGTVTWHGDKSGNEESGVFYSKNGAVFTVKKNEVEAL